MAAFSEEERTAVYEQLEHLLSSRFFHHSRRFPAFLRYVVEHSLAGTTDLLKERTLSVQVFGKPSAYDTGSDSIVPVTAAEIRKRIAQYYQEPEHAGELRLLLPPGSYVLQFSWPVSAGPLDTASVPDPLITGPVPVLSLEPQEKTAFAARNGATVGSACSPPNAVQPGSQQR